MKSMNTNNAAGVPVEATASETRLAAAPAGAHVISGLLEDGTGDLGVGYRRDDDAERRR